MGSRMAKALVGMCGLLLGMVFLPASGGAATPSVASWQQAIHALPLSSSGCFTAAFPVLQWRSVTCQTAPDVPFAPATSSSTPSTLSTVGNGVDYSALSSGGLLSSVTGSFPYVSPGITEKGVVPVTGDPKMHNTFSLQLNSSFFSGSPACSGASNPTKCEGWQQFVETTSPSTQSQSELFMQYWLIDYGTTCPAGWFTYSPDCYMNSATVPTSSLTAPGLASVSLEGSAAKGGNDIGTLTTRTNAYAVTGSDSVVDLASSWSADRVRCLWRWRLHRCQVRRRHHAANRNGDEQWNDARSNVRERRFHRRDEQPQPGEDSEGSGGFEPQHRLRAEQRLHDEVVVRFECGLSRRPHGGSFLTKGQATV